MELIMIDQFDTAALRTTNIQFAIMRIIDVTYSTDDDIDVPRAAIVLRIDHIFTFTIVPINEEMVDVWRDALKPYVIQSEVWRQIKFQK